MSPPGGRFLWGNSNPRPPHATSSKVPVLCRNQAPPLQMKPGGKPARPQRLGLPASPRRGAEGLSFPQQPRLSGTWVFPGCGPPPCPVPAAKGCHRNHLSNSSSWTLSPGPPTGRPPTPEGVGAEPGSRAGSRGHGAAIIPAHVRGHGGHLGKGPGARACRARGLGPAGTQALARAGPGVPYLAASRLS